MQNRKIKTPTIIRLLMCVIAMINQAFALFGKEYIGFVDNPTYQIISFLATVVIVAINAWYNNDITKAAILTGEVFDALKDGKITADEVSQLMDAHKDERSEVIER